MLSSVQSEEAQPLQLSSPLSQAPNFRSRWCRLRICGDFSGRCQRIFSFDTLCRLLFGEALQVRSQGNVPNVWRFLVPHCIPALSLMGSSSLIFDYKSYFESKISMLHLNSQNKR